MKGVWTALITPLQTDGALDLHAFARCIERQVDHVDGVVLAGSTGGGHTLFWKEIETLLLLAKNIAPKLPIFVGTGQSSTSKTLFQTQRAQELGADGALVVMPPYVRPTGEGCFQHFEVLQSLRFPITLYYHPGRTGVKLTPQEVLQIASLPYIVAIKDSSGSVDFFDQLTKGAKPVLCGDDLLFKACKGSGSISVVGNLFPELWGKLDHLPILECLTLEPNPQCVQYAAHLMGLCTPNLRLPLIQPTPETREKIEASLKFALH